MRTKFCVLLILSLGILYAQGERGTLNGTITDPTGAAVPGATVKAMQVETGVETTFAATDAGVYRMPNLQLGNYRITASAPGFKTALADNVTLRVAQVLTVDLKLEVGNVTDQITVSAESPLIESGTAEIGRYVTEAEFDTWPILVSDGQRQIQDFIFRTLPGTTGNTFQGSINGGQYYSHEILIEGIPLGRMDLQGGSNNEFSPSPEAISEFKMQTGAIDARYGGGQTAVANFAIKSGTNRLHGTGFTYVQNDWLRANSFANNAIGRKRAPYKLFNWGYALGGPVYIPKLYDGRNRTFFFTDFEDNRVRDFNSIALSTLPTTDFKQGDFGRLLNAGFTGRARSGTNIGTDPLGRPVIAGQIYDPATTRTVNGQVVRDPFPGNVIPQNRFSTVAKNILQQAPITDPVFDRMLNNIPNISTSSPIFDQSITAIKGDHLVSDKHRISAYYNHTKRIRNNSPGGRWGIPPGTPTGVYQLQETPGRLARAAWDWTIAPTVLNHFAMGYNRFGNLNQSVFVDQGWPEKIGLRNVPNTHFPTLQFQGQPHLGGGIGAGGRLGSGNAGGGWNGSTITQDDLTIIQGKHNFKMGFELRKYYYNSFGRGTESGNFNFSSLQTQLPGFVDDTGHAFASFLLGAAASTNRNVVQSFFGHRTTTPTFYFADDWKTTRKLTLNLGLRWEIVGPLNEVAGRMSALDFALPNPEAGGRPGALAFADERNRKSFQNWYWKQISPRFGFAYQLNDRMVVRGGYGINNTPNISNGFGFGGTLGYNGNINLSPTNVNLQFPQDPVFLLDNPYPSFAGGLPNRNPALSNNLGVNYIAPDSNRLAYVQNFSLGFQFALPGASVLEIAYIGNKGTRLEANGLDNLNQLPVSFLSLGDRLLEPLSQNPTLAPLPYAGFTGTVAQALRAYPQFQNIDQQWSNFGTSTYNSVQTTLTRHFRGGFQGLIAYTWSKSLALVDSSIDSSGSQDVYNRGLEKSITAYDVPHFLKGAWILDLPWGPGKPINIGGVAGAILGGWRISGIHNYRTGDPLQVITSGLQGGRAIFNGTIRPDLLSGVPINIHVRGPIQFGQASLPYLNPAAFAQVPRTAQNVPLRLGTGPRYLPNVRGPIRVSEDFGFIKQFIFSESSNLEIRADFINAFNRAGRGNPQLDITNPQFGHITGPAYGPRNIQFGARISF